MGGMDSDNDDDVDERSSNAGHSYTLLSVGGQLYGFRFGNDYPPNVIRAVIFQIWP
jgi:hypothetical protein